MNLSMILKRFSALSDLFTKALQNMMGQSPNATPVENPKVPIDRKILTLCILSETYTKKRTSAFIADKWKEISDLLEEGFSQIGEITPSQAKYLDAVKSVSTSIRNAGNFDAKIMIPQNEIDVLVSNHMMPYRAKQGLLQNLKTVNEPVDIEIIDLPDGEWDFIAATSDDHNEIIDKQDKLALFAFKVFENLKGHATGIGPEIYHSSP